MQEHIVKSFDAQIDALNRKIEETAKACESQLSSAAQAFEYVDKDLAKSIVKKDDNINRLQREIEDACVRLLALRQPMAADLRYLLSCMKIASELERIGDYAANISKRVTELSETPSKEPSDLILEMIQLCNRMLKNSMDAFFNADAQNAVKVWHKDDEIDRKFARMMTCVRSQMQDEKDLLDNSTQLIFVGRCCERIGDHITNIAEDIYFMVTGRNYMDIFEDQ